LFVEVTAPAALTGESREWRPMRDWLERGVRPLDDAVIAADLPARLQRPDGASGPALLTFNNYDVLMRYNGGWRYGVAASLLARAIGGQPPLQTPWPHPADALTSDEILVAQQALTILGYDVGIPDGVYGERTWLALNAFARANNLPTSDYPTRALYQALVQP
jgi:peptidoglycan hydrolase-like protein with peptidoglycan-binding domain